MKDEEFCSSFILPPSSLRIMGLLKSFNPSASAAAPFSMRDIENQARAIILRARQQAEQLLAAAQVEAEQLQQQAHELGREEGFVEGKQQGLAEGRAAGHEQASGEHRKNLTQLVSAVTQMIEEIESSRQRLAAESIGDVVDLAVAIGRRVTKRQGAIDPAVLTTNLAEAMKLVIHASDVRIAVHPTQKETLDGELPRLRLQWPNLQHVELTEDSTLSPGGCRIVTREGQIDADLDVQLDRVVADLMPAFSSTPSPGTPGEGRGEGSSASVGPSTNSQNPRPNPLPAYRERGQEASAT